MRSCAILIPSLNRPQNLEFVLRNIEEATPEPHRIYFCVSDDESKEILDGKGHVVLDDSGCGDRRYVTRMNKLVKLLDDEESIFFGSDDVVHHPGWLTTAWAVMAQGPSVVVVNDRRNPNGTQAVIRREYIDLAVFDSPGDAFHHGYQHNFADTEQFFTAYKREQYARAMDSVVEHLHPIFQSPNARPWDDTYTNAQRGWDHDIALFNERAAEIDRVIGP